jgi:hypothetical protein
MVVDDVEGNVVLVVIMGVVTCPILIVPAAGVARTASNDERTTMARTIFFLNNLNPLASLTRTEQPTAIKQLAQNQLGIRRRLPRAV